MFASLLKWGLHLKQRICSHWLSFYACLFGLTKQILLMNIENEYFKNTQPFKLVFYL